MADRHCDRCGGLLAKDHAGFLANSGRELHICGECEYVAAMELNGNQDKLLGEWADRKIEVAYSRLNPH